jgi:hypothetical protein
MPQKFLSIKNFEKYQSYTKKNPPWFKIHRCMFGDVEFMKLSTHHRFLYVGLIHLAVETNNRIYNCTTWIGQRLYIPPTEVDLRPLYRCGFLATSNLHRTLSETETEERQRRVEDISSASPPPHKKFHATVYPDGFAFDERAEALATSYGLNPYKELAAFRDHHSAKGSLFKDWQAAYRTWLRHAVKFAAKVAR